MALLTCCYISGLLYLLLRWPDLLATSVSLLTCCLSSRSSSNHAVASCFLLASSLTTYYPALSHSLLIATMIKVGFELGLSAYEYYECDDLAYLTFSFTRISEGQCIPIYDLPQCFNHPMCSDWPGQRRRCKMRCNCAPALDSRLSAQE